jgi:ATP-dependent protease HslVU (ClpYQ) ATPase subunit
VATELEITHNTVSTWLKDENMKKIIEKYEFKRKKMRMSNTVSIEEALLKWFSQIRSKNIPVNGPMLESKANEIAEKLGVIFINQIVL